MNEEQPTEEEIVDVEVVDVLPVLAPRGDVMASSPQLPVAAPVPMLQTAAVAATGFLAGAAALALLHRRDTRRLARELSDLRAVRDQYQSMRRAPAPLPLEPGRSYVFHVRVLGRSPQ